MAKQAFADAVDDIDRWLKDFESEASKICSEPFGAEPSIIEEQLNQARAINNEIVANRKLIDDLDHAAVTLIGSLEDWQMSMQETTSIRATSTKLQNHYLTMADSVATR